MVNKTIIPADRIEQSILLIRKQKVMLDADLAALYGVETRVLVQAVKRNLERFPEDFMFRLNNEETSLLRSQIVTLEKGRGKYSKYRPYAFTEQGIAMLSSVLRSQRAIRVNKEKKDLFTLPVRFASTLSTHNFYLTLYTRCGEGSNTQGCCFCSRNSLLCSPYQYQ